MPRYKVEIRGLSIVTESESLYGREVPLEDGPVGGFEVIDFTVSANDPEHARQRVINAVAEILSDELDGGIERKSPPDSYG